MKKRVNYLLPVNPMPVLLIVSMAILAGCDVLDNPRPRQSLPIGEVTDDVQGVRSLVTGLYDGIQDADLAGGNFNILPELMSDNVLFSGSFANYQRVHSHSMIPENPTTSWWTDSYETINAANLILELVPEIEDADLTDAEADIILGDASFIRGMLYFELARVFSKPWQETGDGSQEGVPLRTTSVTSIDQFENLPRASLQATLERAEEDLLRAAELLPDTRVRSNSSVDPNGEHRATRYAALGYLMRLELARQDYEAAAEYARQIMDAQFALTEHPEGPFRNEFSSESIFEVIHTSTDNPGVNAGVSAFYTPSLQGGRGDITISASFVQAFQAVVTGEQRELLDLSGLIVEDLRQALLTSLQPGTGATLKYPDASGNTDNVMNLRYAEVLLSRAEALVELSATLGDVPAEAYELLNLVRIRSLNVRDAGTGLEASDASVRFAPADFSDKQELLDAILLERRIELAFEGDRFHTLQRKGLSVRGVPAGDNRLLFPLPQQEVDANPLIDQHGDY